MPKPRKNELIACRYFAWRLLQRDGVYYADGRSNQHDLGKHSLGTRNREAALQALQELDIKKAVEHGLAKESALRSLDTAMLSLTAGRQLYETYLSRPSTLGGPEAGTVKRYRPVLDKFFLFAAEERVEHWNEVTKEVLVRYCAWLNDQDYAERTQNLEITTLKQIVRWMVEEKHLPADALIHMTVKKVRGTTTYCYSQAEIRAMIEHCEQKQLHWLHSLIVCLATTGMRIGEVVQLRWRDLDLEQRVVHLRHEDGRKGKQDERQTTKGRRARTIPLQEPFIRILETLPRHSDGRVFHGSAGGRLKPDRVRHAFRRDVLTPLASQFPVEAGSKGILAGTLHSFRHAYASSAAESGKVSEPVLRRILGHENSEMVNHYYHQRPDAVAKALEAVRFLGDDSSAA